MISFADQEIRSVTISQLQVGSIWKDGSMSWEKLSNLKESHPLQTEEVKITQGIDHEHAFNWWVKHVLKKWDRIFASIRKWQERYLKRNYKFGIELPKTVEQALNVNAKNSNTFWTDTESENVRVALNTK